MNHAVLGSTGSSELRSFTTVLHLFPCRSISTFKKSTIKINPLKLLKTYSEHAPNTARGAKIRLKNVKMFRNDQNHNKETLAFDHMLCDQFRENLGGVFLRRLILYPQYKMRRNDRYSTVNDASHRVLYRSFRRISYWGYSMRDLRNTPPTFRRYPHIACA